MLVTGRIYICLQVDVFVMEKIGPNPVGVMVINAMAKQGDMIMSMRFWPLTKMHFDNNFLLSKVEEFLCRNPFSESKEEFFSGVKKLLAAIPLGKKMISNKVQKLVVSLM